jgi:hypothetical protein
MRQLVDNRVPTRGGVGRTQGSSRRTTKDVGYGNIFQIPPVPGFSVPLLRPRPTSVLRSFRPRPHGRLKTVAGLAAASERRALALLPGCPPPAPTPSSYR